MIPLDIKFGPSALGALILLIISDIFFSVTGFQSNGFVFEFLRESENCFLERSVFLSMFPAIFPKKLLNHLQFSCYHL